MSSYCGFRRTILSRSGEWRGWTGLWSRRKSTCEYSYITARPCADAKTYSEVLYRTYERYVEIQGERTRAQRSWVSGLEPAYQSYTTGHEAIPEVPRRCAYKSWIESEMYYKHGVEVKREGRFEGIGQMKRSGIGWSGVRWMRITLGQKSKSLSSSQKRVYLIALWIRNIRHSSAAVTVYQCHAVRRHHRRSQAE
jgi:hypothetical protein